MEDLEKMAQQLGAKLAADERTILLKQAQKAAQEDPEAMKLMEEYKTQAEKIHQLETDGKPIEVTDKHALQTIEENISTNEKLKELTRRQMDFVDMMRKVKQAIDGQLQIQV